MLGIESSGVRWTDSVCGEEIKLETVLDVSSQELNDMKIPTVFVFH
jgi:hypothetical protein